MYTHELLKSCFSLSVSGQKVMGCSTEDLIREMSGCRSVDSCKDSCEVVSRDHSASGEGNAGAEL